RLPFVRDLARSYLGVDMVTDPVPVRPVVHYTMGGIHMENLVETPLKGLYAAGECACVSINGSNRLGSNSLTECLVFGREAGQRAAEQIGSLGAVNDTLVKERAEASRQALADLHMRPHSGESVSGIRREMHDTMESGAGIYRTADSLAQTCTDMANLRDRFNRVALEDKSAVYNTDLIQALELQSMVEIAETMAHSATKRTESRGSHQRLDFAQRDDEVFLKHSLATYNGQAAPTIDYRDVVITKSQPAARVYGGDV
ncbi:MAG: FAD-binding protein, partial [Flavobacteriales bacterium]|nr:FAD-binding protein [Flavobacteriales bacterium]